MSFGTCIGRVELHSVKQTCKHMLSKCCCYMVTFEMSECQQLCVWSASPHRNTHWNISSVASTPGSPISLSKLFLPHTHIQSLNLKTEFHPPVSLSEVKVNMSCHPQPHFTNLMYFQLWQGVRGKKVGRDLISSIKNFCNLYALYAMF